MDIFCFCATDNNQFFCIMVPCPKPNTIRNQHFKCYGFKRLFESLRSFAWQQYRQIHMIVWNMIPMVPWAPTECRSKPKTGCAGHHFLQDQKTWTQFRRTIKIMFRFRMQISRLLSDACDFVKTNSS